MVVEDHHQTRLAEGLDHDVHDLDGLLPLQGGVLADPAILDRLLRVVHLD
jgi:hypothetical protein